jgi:uncharacterized membrane protein
MKYIVALLSCLLLSILTSADYISYIHIDIENTGKVGVKETITLSSEEQPLESINVPSDAGQLSVYDQIGPVSYTTVENESKVMTLSVRKPSRSQKEFYVQYLTQQFTSKSEGVWKLEFNLPTSAYRTIIKIKFPTNSTIFNWTPYRFNVEPDVLYVYPDTDETNFTATYQFAGEPATPLPSLKRAWWPYALGILIVAGAGFHLYSIRKRRRQSETGIKLSELEVTHDDAGTVVAVEQGEVSEAEEHTGRELKESVLQMLEENELKVVDVLRGFDEEITQAQVYHTTGLPKASLSDIMNRLERRNIIERSKEGRVKWVKLKKWVYK